ncbi:MAG: glycosyltransferase family 4 protein [Oscillospiraceae bacterium]|nr:glycosyltransferase family 4 protein [Oscillospiraceae bacterium]
MNISFDALPLMGRLTGIGYCQAGQVTAMTRLHPEQSFTLNYFAMRHLDERKSDLQPYLRENVTARHAFCSPYLYRLISACIPVPYHWFFGKKADVTHFFNYIVPPFVHGKTVVTVHDMVYRAYPETVRGRTKHMLDLGLVKSMQRADRIVTDSEFSKREIIKYYPAFAGKIRVVPCGVDTKRFHPETDAGKITQVREKYGITGEYFLYLGTLEPRKNLERLLDAYAVFAKRRENPARLVLAGGKGWLYDGIFAKVQQLGLEEYVIFTQYIDAADMCALMSGALAFTFPSIYEGFGMPPLEAMACGTPVLVSDAASLPEVTGESAVIVKPDSTESIAEGLERLFTDAALRNRLSAEGLERAAAFSWERSARMLYEVYAELLPALKENGNG